MIAELLLVGCWSNAPLDQADRDGRPVVVLLDRGDEASNRQMARWLRAAKGPARSRLESVALVYATPAEVEAWTQASVADDDRLLAVDNHRLVSHAAFQLSPELWNAPPIPGRPPKDSPLIDVIRGSGPPQPETAPPRDIYAEFDAYEYWLIETWDQGLQHLLADAPPAPTPLRVFGAARCADGCGAFCDRDESEVIVNCGMGEVNPRIHDFLKRWPPEAP